MGYPTDIEWTDATWNPVGGCSIASPGCGPCYAQKLAGTRLKHHPLYAGTTDLVKGRPIFNGTMTAAPAEADVWTWPLSWRGATNPEHPPKLGPGMPSTIFVGDMSDVFHENRSANIRRLTLIKIAASRHVGQFVTKRPAIMAEQVEELRVHRWTGIPVNDERIRSHFWFGASAERQKEFDERWPHLRRLAELGFIVFISYEPALGPLALPPDFLALRDRAWLIAGGPSGDRAWPAHPDWFRSVRDQCGSAGVPFFFKQWGEWAEVDGPRCRSVRADVYGTDRWLLPDGISIPLSNTIEDRYSAWTTSRVRRVGKKAAGHLLDGVEHRAFPRITTTAIGAAA